MTGFSLRTRLTIGLVAAAVLPMLVFALLVTLAALAFGQPQPDENVGRLAILALAAGVLLAIFIGLALGAQVTSRLREIAAAVDRTAAGDLSTPIDVSGDDELARLVESHNRLARTIDRRTRELGQIRVAVETAPPGGPLDALAARAAEAARDAFAMNDAIILLVNEAEIPTEEVVPGIARPIRATLAAGGETLGVFIGRLPPTRSWEKADQDLLELYASEVAIAIRNAQLLARVETQNEELRELGEAKDDFFRAVSHNLQTPLARIRALGEGLMGESGDRRAGMIVEQSERLSRMVRQLVTLTRLESGTLRPRADVLSVAVRASRAWDALAATEVPFSIEDRSAGWLAVADVDALDQVLWALLDNAVKYGAGAPVAVDVSVDGSDGDRSEGDGIEGDGPGPRLIRLRISDGGPGIADEDRQRLFERFARGGREPTQSGLGLGLYVSRELCRAMGGDLVLELPAASGATFAVSLPGEPPTE